MAENSNFILRWEIDNATTRLASGRAESGVFNEGGFEWIAEVNRRVVAPHDLSDFTLRCDVDHNGPWKCEAEVGVYLLISSGSFFKSAEKIRFCFDKNSSNWIHQCDRWWDTLHSCYKINDKITVEFRISIISSEREKLVAEAKFSAPNRMSNVILNIGDKKLHVYKELLALHSPVFEAMFFGDFIESGKEEVEIKDVVYEEFIDLIHLLYLGTMKITDRTVVHLLKLADQFQIESVLEQSKKYLTESKGFDVVKKLMVADQYNLDTLRDHCLESFTSVAELKEKLKLSPDYDKFSERMMAAIYIRIMKI